eukprot:5726910-Prorocentrum_lima.AAC.1
MVHLPWNLLPVVHHGVCFLGLGHITPWPNRAEAAVQLFKHHALILFDHAKAYGKMEPYLNDVSASEM